MIRFFRRLLCSPTWQDYYRAYHVFKQYNRASGRKVRKHFFDHMSIASFYGMMARLEKRGVVVGESKNKVLYVADPNGEYYYTIQERHYTSLIRNSSVWRKL